MWTGKYVLTMVLFMAAFVGTFILIHAQWPGLREGEVIAVGVAVASIVSLFYAKEK